MPPCASLYTFLHTVLASLLASQRPLRASLLASQRTPCTPPYIYCSLYDRLWLRSAPRRATREIGSDRAKRGLRTSLSSPSDPVPRSDHGPLRRRLRLRAKIALPWSTLPSKSDKSDKSDDSGCSSELAKRGRPEHFYSGLLGPASRNRESLSVNF